jgi:hypothetical protein
MNIKHPARWAIGSVLLIGLAGALNWRMGQTEDTKGKSGPS